MAKVNNMEKIFRILKYKKAKRIGLVIGVIYFIFYLYSIGNITIVEMPESLSFRVVDGWQEKIFKPIAPFLWEPIAVFYIYKGVSIFFSVPNFVIALFLSLLVYLNIAVAVYSYSLSKVCQFRQGFKGPLGFLPSLFTGFTCCVPTFLIALGPVLANFTVFFIKIRQFLIPISFIIMILGLLWSLKRIPPNYIQIFEKRKT